MRWYAVYTRPHNEARALEHLLRQGYSAYLPRYRTQISHARRHQTVLRPLFPRYLFAGIDRVSMPWRPILSTVGVADVVRAGDEPAPVPSGIVTAIREREEAGGFDRLNPCQSLRLGELVRVTAGALRIWSAGWSNCETTIASWCCSNCSGGRCGFSSARRLWKQPERPVRGAPADRLCRSPLR
jgi:transcriptional antiterminator RfaH